MVDVSCRASCEDFEVEFSSGTVSEDAGITEENISEREALLEQYSLECKQELERLTSCIWEIRDNRDKTVSILSNADIEKGLKSSRGSKVVVGKTALKDSRWILERV